MSTDSVIRLMERASNLIDEVGDGLIVDYIIADLKYGDYDALAVHLQMAEQVEREFEASDVY